MIDISSMDLHAQAQDANFKYEDRNRFKPCDVYYTCSNQMQARNTVTLSLSQSRENLQ